MSTIIEPLRPPQTGTWLGPKPRTSDRPPRPKSWRARSAAALKLLGGVGLLALVGWAATHWLVPGADRDATITATVRRVGLPITVTERGELESSVTKDVRCEVEGGQNKIVEIVPEGTRVTKDQVVVRFDTEELSRRYAEQEIKLKQAEGKEKAAKEELEVQKNKADSEVAKAQLALILGVLDQEKYLEGEYQVEVDNLNGLIKLAEHDLQEAEEKLKHYEKFVKKGFGTTEQLHARRAVVEQMRHYLNRDKAKLLVLQKYTHKRQETELTAKAEEAQRELARARSSGNAAIAKAQSDFEAAEVTAKLEKNVLAKQQKQLDNCVVKAPAEGILVFSKERWWDDSTRIQSGAMVHFQQPLFSIPDLTRMQMKVKVHEAMIKKVAKDQKAEIRIDAFPNQVLQGTIEKVATLASSDNFWMNRGVKEYECIVKIDNLPTDAGLKPGMTGEVKVHVNHLPDVIVVPVQAVAENEGQHYTYVVGPKGVERRPVSVGENNEKFVEIKDGLAVGEQVALDARARITAESKAKEGGQPQPPTTPAEPKSAQPTSVVASPTP
ncbi:MAG: efflux RND transporter periplasmic adaptor subunit [Planctomycetes bacterium]|nr:efflux RND transporter periplasmic adaptor subunit [Planctomycetota bacterium]